MMAASPNRNLAIQRKRAASPGFPLSFSDLTKFTSAVTPPTRQATAAIADVTSVNFQKQTPSATTSTAAMIQNRRLARLPSWSSSANRRSLIVKRFRSFSPIASTLAAALASRPRMASGTFGSEHVGGIA